MLVRLKLFIITKLIVHPRKKPVFPPNKYNYFPKQTSRIKLEKFFPCMMKFFSSSCSSLMSEQFKHYPKKNDEREKILQRDIKTEEISETENKLHRLRWRALFSIDNYLIRHDNDMCLLSRYITPFATIDLTYQLVLGVRGMSQNQSDGPHYIIWNSGNKNIAYGSLHSNFSSYSYCHA